jgi:LmbE family N-acetylglucosaminyl deacetylase
MATLVCFHAHPDDEAISTGGTMARAADEGHRVVLVVATNGDHGEVPDDLGDGETLVARRRAETDASAAVLGIDRVAWLGYTDSGMNGWKQNGEPASFHRAPVDEAAERLAAILREESADVLTIYDWHGTYGHPDHVKVHQVGRLAAELAGGGLRVVEVTVNRDAMATMIEEARASGVDDGTSDAALAGDFDPHAPADDGNPFGEPEVNLTLAVDVSAYAARKRASIACHRSQVSDSSFFLEMPPEAFVQAFGTEWFIEHDRTPPMRTGWLFEPAD